MVRAGFTVEGSELKQQRFRVYPSPSRRSLVGLSFRARVQGLGFRLRLLCPPPPPPVVRGVFRVNRQGLVGGCRGGGGIPLGEGGGGGGVDYAERGRI